MSQRSLVWPFSLIIAFGTLLLLLLLGNPPHTSVAQATCDSPYTPADCTATALAKATPSSPSPVATNTIGSATPGASPTTGPTLSATATLIGTRTVQATSPIINPSRTVTPTPTQTSQVAPLTPAVTATTTASDDQALFCAPGTTITLTGTTRPNLALLLYFNNRPVGGSLARDDGSYTVMMHIGDERPGRYPVELRERDNRNLVRKLSCEVPGGTPTPTRSSAEIAN